MATGLAALLVALMLLQATREPPPPPAPPPAPEYRVEIDGGGWIRHADGRRWAIDDYHGETARLEIGPLPGIGRRFLVAHILSGAYQFRLVVFEVHEDGSLTLCASGWTIAEGAQNEYLFEIAFGDVDGQDVFLESHRRWLFDDGGGIIAGWAVCTVAHAWTGSRFEPRWLYLWGADEESPWVPIDPPDEAGIERAEKAATALILAALHR